MAWWRRSTSVSSRPPRAEHEAALHVARDEAVVLEGDGEAVGRGSGQTGGTDELREGGRSGLQRAEHRRCLVEYADP